MSSRAFRLLVATLVATSTPSLLQAQETSGRIVRPGSVSVQESDSTPAQPPSTAGRFELSAEYGVRAGGLVRVPEVDLPLDLASAPAWTARASWWVRPTIALGVVVSRQRTELVDQDTATARAEVDLEVQHLQARLLLAQGTVRPVLDLSFGRTRFGLADDGAGESHPSLGLGTGALLALGSGLDLVTRLQLWATLLGGNDRILCGDSAAPCLETTNDTVLLQLQLGAGVAWRF